MEDLVKIGLSRRICSRTTEETRLGMDAPPFQEISYILLYPIPHCKDLYFLRELC